MTLLEVESALDDADSTGVTQHILRPLMGAASEFRAIATPRMIEKMIIAILGSDCTYCIFSGLLYPIPYIYIYHTKHVWAQRKKDSEKVSR